MPKKEIITDREIATDIARNANNANLSMTIDEYRKTRTVKFRLTEIAVVIAIVAALIVSKCSKKYEGHTLLIELPEYKTPKS